MSVLLTVAALALWWGGAEGPMYIRDGRERSVDMYDRLLVATDGSAGSEAVVERAVSIAARFDTVVDALAVVDETFPALTGYDPVVERIEAEAEAALDAVIGACERADVDAEPHLRRGIPHEEIVAAVDAYGSDLVVMGTHRRSGFDRVRHRGSVAERVVRRSPVPVLTTPLVPPERET
jgi:nucleotide-binding universal stress UspA family protein